MADFQSKAAPFKLNRHRGVVRFQPRDRAEVVALHESGLSQREVVDETGWPAPTVAALLKYRARGGGPPPKERKPPVKEGRSPRPQPAEDRPNPLDAAREWLVLRQSANQRPARFKEADNQFWLLDDRGTWRRAGLDQVMREAFRVARRNGVRLELPNANWMVD